jgi:hypothetical protein
MNTFIDKESLACTPQPIKPDAFNLNCVLPYSLTAEHIAQSMQDFLNFFGFINQQLYTRGTPRLESFLMPANFSSIVGVHEHQHPQVLPRFGKESVP